MEENNQEMPQAPGNERQGGSKKMVLTIVVIVIILVIALFAFSGRDQSGEVAGTDSNQAAALQSALRQIPDGPLTCENLPTLAHVAQFMGNNLKGINLASQSPVALDDCTRIYLFKSSLEEDPEISTVTIVGAPCDNCEEAYNSGVESITDVAKDGSAKKLNTSNPAFFGLTDGATEQATAAALVRNSGVLSITADLVGTPEINGEELIKSILDLY